MADYIYTMETRLSPEQLRGVSLVQEITRVQEINVYLTGGAVRDLISGLPIHDLDFSIQANPLKLHREWERAGITIQGVDDDLKVVYALLPGNVRAEIGMTRSEIYEKPGKPPIIAPATINDDLRRRDFTINAMALSLNPGSRGLLLDPSNGIADIEAKLIRILHNYAFYEEPSRLLRATHYAARFHWPLEERTLARYNAAKENNYIEHISSRAIGLEIEQLVHEDDPLHIMDALEKEDWLKVLNPHWSVAKADRPALTQLFKLKKQMYEFGYTPDTGAPVLYFLTRRLPDKDVADIRKLIPRRDLVESWKRLENDAKDLARKLTGKEAATPSRAWHLLSHTKPETILFTESTTKQQAVSQKINNFFGKWRQVKQRLPLPEMAEMHITPALPAYPKLAEEAFMLLLDGKLRSRGEVVRFLKPYAPPPPPPPPPPRRGKGAKAEAGATVPGKPGRKGAKAQTEAASVPLVLAPAESPTKELRGKRRGRPPAMPDSKASLPPAPTSPAKEAKPLLSEPPEPKPTKPAKAEPAANLRPAKAQKKRGRPPKSPAEPKPSRRAHQSNKRQKRK